MTVHYSELFGLRKDKYAALNDADVESTQWQSVEARAPFYLFVPRDYELEAEYERAWKITDAMPVHSVGIVTGRDAFVIDLEEDALRGRISDFVGSALSDGEVAARYGLHDKKGWTVRKAREELRGESEWQRYLAEILYRPFDVRHIMYHGSVVERTRRAVMRYLPRGISRGLHVCRQIISPNWQHIFATNRLTDDCYVSDGSRERGYTCPVYLAALDDEREFLNIGRVDEITFDGSQSRG